VSMGSREEALEAPIIHPSFSCSEAAHVDVNVIRGRIQRLFDSARSGVIT
jgi:hypothetical protein